MFGAELRNLDTDIRGIDHSLVHASDFISEHKGVFRAFTRTEILKHHRILRLLYADYSVTL